MAVSRDHFTFFSAESADQAPAATGIEERMDKVEAGLDKLLSIVSQLRPSSDATTTPGTAQGTNPRSRGTGATAKAPPGQPASMEPMLVQQALAFRVMKKTQNS